MISVIWERINNGWPLVRPNLPSMLVEVLIIGGGLSLILFLFQKRKEKRDLAIKLSDLTHNHLVFTSNALRSLKNDKIEEYRNNKRKMASVRNDVNRLRLPFDKLLRKNELDALDDYVNRFEFLHGSVSHNITDQNNTASAILNLIKAQFSPTERKPYSAFSKVYWTMAARLWGLTLLPFSRRSIRLDRQLLQNINDQIGELTTGKSVSKKKSKIEFKTRVMSLDEVENIRSLSNQEVLSEQTKQQSHISRLK